MAEKTTTQTTEQDNAGNKKESTTQTQTDRPEQPTAPAPAHGVDNPKTGKGSQTNPSGIGGNEESVSG